MAARSCDSTEASSALVTEPPTVVDVAAALLRYSGSAQVEADSMFAADARLAAALSMAPRLDIIDAA